MRLVLPLLLSVCAHAATLTIDPPVIYDCTGSVGKATVRWQGAIGPVQLVVGSANGLFASSDQTSGAAETGTWVSDGLEFRLIGRQGALEALAVARVRCNTPQVPGNGLVSESYFPLEPGNTWIYRMDSRAGTANYVTWTVTGLRVAGGRTYSEISSMVESNTSVALLLREESGSLFRWTGARDELYLNPAMAQHAPFRSALGSYPDAASQTTMQGALIRESQTFVRGVGLARSRSDLMTGSSGGFVSGLELVEFRLATGPKVAPPTPAIALSIEKTLLDVTGKQLDNCIIPCYFSACGLGSPVDPPGTYKPCVRTRIEAAGPGENLRLLLTLRNQTGAAVLVLDAGQFSGETVRYEQLPLYTEPNKPVPSGIYLLEAQMTGSRERIIGSFAVAALILEIR